MKDVRKIHNEDLSQRDVSRRTVQSHGMCLKAHTLQNWGELLVDEINSAMIRNIINEKLVDKSRVILKNMLKCIKVSF